MKKLLLLSAIAVLSIVGAKAQDAKIRYQGDVQVGYSIGIGALPYDRVNVHIVNGVRIGKYFSAGFGTGLDCMTNVYKGLPELTLPLFLNLKGYLPVSVKTSLFLSADVGGSIGLTLGVEGASGFLITPSVGAAFNVGQKHNAITVSLGYNHQAWSTGFKNISVNTDAISIKLGFSF